MAVCDVCNQPGGGTIVPAADMSHAVERGFNPFNLGLVPDLLKQLGIGSSYDQWRVDAISGDLSRSDWNVCGSCMQHLRPYLVRMRH